MNKKIRKKDPIFSMSKNEFREYVRDFLENRDNDLKPAIERFQREYDVDNVSFYRLK